MDRPVWGVMSPAALARWWCGGRFANLDAVVGQPKSPDPLRMLHSTQWVCNAIRLLADTWDVLHVHFSLFQNRSIRSIAPRYVAQKKQGRI